MGPALLFLERCLSWPEWYLIPFVLQAGAIFFDEFYFHHKRGLPKWERVGHPLDTLTVFVCFLFLVLAPYNPLNLAIFFALAVFSSLFVTKDEFIHKDVCSKSEMWLHSVLFILHPVTFIVAGWLWHLGQGSSILQFQTAVVFLFMIYQIYYWSFHATKSRQQ